MFYQDITIALTSCGRFDLLEKTITSIGETIDLSRYRKILTEDSQDVAHIAKMQNAKENGFLQDWEIIFTGGSLKENLYERHYAALERLYAEISTKYVFHCEDDQIFKKTNFDYFEWSYCVLEKCPKIALILLRDICGDFWLKKTGIKASRYYEILSDHEESLCGHEVIFLNPNESFSLQPWLRRTKLMKELMFWYENAVAENAVSTRLSERWFESVVIKNGIYRHINPIFHSTKNIKNLGLWNYIISTLSGTIRYRGGLITKYIKHFFKK